MVIERTEKQVSYTGIKCISEIKRTVGKGLRPHGLEAEFYIVLKTCLKTLILIYKNTINKQRIRQCKVCISA